MSSCEHDVYGNFTSTLREGNPLQAGVAVLYAALNIFLSITTSLGNALILIALRKVSSVHLPTKLLFQCLAVTDLFIGIITQILYANLMLHVLTSIKLKVFCNILQVNLAITFILCGVSIFISTAISADRLLAHSLGLRYSQVVRLWRVRAFTMCVWLAVISLTGFMHFWRGLGIQLPGGIPIIMLTLLISTFSYTKIFLALRQTFVLDQIYHRPPKGERIPLIIPRYKKTVFSIAWLQLALVVCYVPYIVSVISIRVNAVNDVWGGISGLIVWEASLTLVFLNSSLNRILYCWQISELRKALKDTVRQFLLILVRDKKHSTGKEELQVLLVMCSIKMMNETANGMASVC